MPEQVHSDMEWSRWQLVELIVQAVLAAVSLYLALLPLQRIDHVAEEEGLKWPTLVEKSRVTPYVLFVSRSSCYF